MTSRPAQYVSQSSTTPRYRQSTHCYRVTACINRRPRGHVFAERCKVPVAANQYITSFNEASLRSTHLLHPERLPHYLKKSATHHDDVTIVCIGLSCMCNRHYKASFLTSFYMYFMRENIWISCPKFVNGRIGGAFYPAFRQHHDTLLQWTE